jgi:hypothetical protein
MEVMRLRLRRQPAAVVTGSQVDDAEPAEPALASLEAVAVGAAMPPPQRLGPVLA